MARREVPFNPILAEDEHSDEPMKAEPAGPRLHETRPLNPFAALLEAPPFEEPEWSRAELLPLRDVVADAIDDALTPRQRFVFDLIATERLSRREAAAILSLSKSQVDRIYHQACARLRYALEDNPLVKEYLTR